MSASYQPILWNRQKKIYDRILILFILIYLSLFIGLNLIFYPEVTQETLIIRSTSTLALFLLHVILAIGPLTRLNRIFLPLLYNRRHLGVTMFCMAAIHGIFSVIQFHSLGNVNPLISVFASNMHYESLIRFPFQILGFLALIIFFLMAITSHDFWLNNLTPKVWKTLHMFVYLAYALIIMHVMLGVIQYETSPILFSLIIIGFMSISTLHILAGNKEKDKENQKLENLQNGFLLACHVDDLEENKGKVISLDKERVALFRYDNKVSAVSNVCKHQNGPLGEGRIIDGCITCPWHGYQYQPDNGSSPPPFTEKVATYEVKVMGNEVWVNPNPFPEGTELKPAMIVDETPMQA